MLCSRRRRVHGMHVTRNWSHRSNVCIGRSRRPDGLPREVAYEQGDWAIATSSASLAGAGEVIDLAYATAPQDEFRGPDLRRCLNRRDRKFAAESVAAGVSRVRCSFVGGHNLWAARGVAYTGRSRYQTYLASMASQVAIENYGWMFHTLFD